MTDPHVVVGVDGSLVAVRALDWAAEEAVRRGTALRIVYAVPCRDEAGPVLASAAARVHQRHPGLTVESGAVERGAVEALAAESVEAALTVVGTRGLGSVTGLVAGSVSWRVAARVRGPLAIVRGDPARGRNREVLLGLESDADDAATAYAFQEAVRRKARLRVVRSSTHRHTAPELPSPVTATSRGRERQPRNDRVEEAVPLFSVARLREKYPEVRVDSRTVHRGPAHALLSGTRHADVVVIGTRQRAIRLGPPLGPVAQTLSQHARCPVVLVPTS